MKPGKFGRWGEDQAAAHLQAKGYEVVARNWRSEYGELDLVVRRDELWVFVEVKARRSHKFGAPQEAVTPAKQRRLLEAAQYYLAEHGLAATEWRIDVLTVYAPDPASRPTIEIFENAVTNW